MINEYKSSSFASGSSRSSRSATSPSLMEIVGGDVAWQGGLGLEKEGGLGRTMDDGIVVLGQKLKYSVGVRNLELEHLRDEFSVADSIDGDDVGISVAAQPGNNQLTMATLNDQHTHQIG